MIRKQSGRQEVISGQITFDHTQIDDDTFHGAIELPNGAEVVSGSLQVVEAAQAGVTADVGDSDTGDRYVDGADATAEARTAFTLTGHVTDGIGDVGVTFSAKPTQGSFKLSVQYVVTGRAAFSQGLDYRGDGVRGA